MKVFVYPGSFDPVTNGHIDIIQRAAVICDKLIVAVLVNQSKNALFSLEERVELLRKSLQGCANIEVCSFSGLLVNFARDKGASVIIKGLRAVSDYEYELQMALLNKKLDEKIETLFMMANLHYSYLSSSIVKDIALLGGDIDGLVPNAIKSDIIEKINGIAQK
ncbi:MAG: pantetheine-phosphate adenylyltransferase [Clostridia bacterium]